MKILPNSLTAGATAAGALLTAAAMFAGGIAYAVHLRDDASFSRAIDADHETRLRGIETRVTHIDDAVTTLQGDVTWIRHNLPAVHAVDGEPQKTASN